jgi:hypothetical protein
VYAKCIDGQDEAARRRIEVALGIPNEEPEPTDEPDGGDQGDGGDDPAGPAAG